MGGNNSVVLENHTDIWLHYSISVLAPYYFGVLKPGEKKTIDTGRVWFTVYVGKWNGFNEESGAKMLHRAAQGLQSATSKNGMADKYASILYAIRLALDSKERARLDKEDERRWALDRTVLVGSEKKVALIPDWKLRNRQQFFKNGHYADGTVIHITGGYTASDPNRQLTYWT